MATTKKGTAKKNPIDDNQIISMYMDFVLEHNEAPQKYLYFL
jgi:hypothetical protein